jgi:hypothetical protein
MTASAFKNLRNANGLVELPEDKNLRNANGLVELPEDQYNCVVAKFKSSLDVLV